MSKYNIQGYFSQQLLIGDNSKCNTIIFQNIIVSDSSCDLKIESDKNIVLYNCIFNAHDISIKGYDVLNEAKIKGSDVSITTNNNLYIGADREKIIAWLQEEEIDKSAIFNAGAFNVVEGIDSHINYFQQEPSDSFLVLGDNENLDFSELNV